MFHSFPEKVVTVRKTHRCWGCYSTIEKGSKALKQSGVDVGNGYFNCWFCDKCASFIKSENFDWQDYDEGLMQGDLPNDYRYKYYKFTLL